MGTLRTQKDNDELAEVAQKGYHAIVVGGGWLGMEAASLLSAKGCRVTMVDIKDLPLERQFGKKGGAVFAKWLHENRVLFMGGSQITMVRGDRTVTGVEL